MLKRERARWFLREWRKHRHLTQDQLASRLETSKSWISELETGKRRWNQDVLELLADALNCEPADLIMRDPTAPNAIWSIWERIPPARRELAIKSLEVFAEPEKKTGTHGS